MRDGTSGTSAMDGARNEPEIIPAVEGAPIMCALSGGDMPHRARELASARRPRRDTEPSEGGWLAFVGDGRSEASSR